MKEKQGNKNTEKRLRDIRDMIKRKKKYNFHGGGVTEGRERKEQQQYLK